MLNSGALSAGCGRWCGNATLLLGHGPPPAVPTHGAICGGVVNVLGPDPISAMHGVAKIPHLAPLVWWDIVEPFSIQQLSGCGSIWWNKRPWRSVHLIWLVWPGPLNVTTGGRPGTTTWQTAGNAHGSALEIWALWALWA